ncbi:MAG TPA: tripartite tricarboxylate transporter substrate binding protein [Bacteroidales bacterium]|nr:tripartite tricarboxylate transporter substrate binding protein [Bacteroidales bacterium]
MSEKSSIKCYLLCILFLFLCSSLNVCIASASEKKYPSRYIELYHGFPGGGAVEVQNRLIAQSLEKQLGGTVVSVSKPGGGGVVGTTALINAAPDGYTLANMGFNSIAQTILLSKGAFTLDDVKVIGQWNVYGMCLSVPADSKWKTFKDFLDHVKKNPGTQYAHAGVGTAGALRMENLNRNAKLMMTAVPFKGDAEVITALLGKHIGAGVSSTSSAKAQEDAGKLRILFSFDPPGKFGLNPKTPYLANIFDKNVLSKDIKVVGFLIAPRKTPDDIAKVLETALENSCKDPALIEGMAKASTAIEFYDSKTATQNLRIILENVKALQQ